MISHNWSPMKRLIWLRGSGITGGSGSWATISGNPVSFTAKAAPLRQLSVAFSPVQSLNGYDAPWPAGGGANIWDEEWESGRFDLSTGALVPDGNSYRSKNFIPAQGSTQYFAKSNTNVAVGCWDANKQYIGRVPNSFKDASLTTLENTAYIKFYSAASSYAGGTSINYPATVTTYSPYSNICPISGWDSLNVEQTSEILAELTSSASANGVTCTTNSDGSVTVKGTCTGNVTLDFFRNSSAFPTGISAGGKYVVSIENPIDVFEVLSYKGVSATTLVSFSNADHAEFTVPSDATGMLVRILAKAGVTYDTTLHVRICPYDGYRSISISLGSTVYSGYVDVVTGVGEITHGIIDMSTLEWSLVSVTYGRWASSAVPNIKAPSTGSEALNGLAEEYKIVTSNAYNNVVGTMYTPPTGVSVQVCNGSTTIKPKGNLVYPLATPITIQLTPQEVQSLVGDNTLWSDANQPITVEYRKN